MKLEPGHQTLRLSDESDVAAQSGRVVNAGDAVCSESALWRLKGATAMQNTPRILEGAVGYLKALWLLKDVEAGLRATIHDAVPHDPRHAACLRM